MDDTISFYKLNSYDYVVNCKPRTFPQGTEVEIFSFSDLRKLGKMPERFQKESM